MSREQVLTSLLDAARKFAEESYDQSTMRQVLINLVHHKEATRILLQEMDLISKELS